MGAQRQINEEIRRRINHRLGRRAPNILSEKIRHSAFRRIMRAQEALEVAGLDQFSLDDPAQHIDPGRSRVQPGCLAKAIINQDVLVRRFEPKVENEFVVVLDLSQSMLYPLRRLYAGRPTDDLSDAQVEAGKINLLKLIAGCFASEASNNGFVVRIVPFGQGRIDPGEPIRRRVNLMADLFEIVDRRMCQVAGHPQREGNLYEQVVDRVGRANSVFLFIGDFIDPVYDWQPPGRARWLRMLGLFRQWAFRRPVVAVRVNHQQEVGPLRRGGTLVPNPWADRCDVQVEQLDSYDPWQFEHDRREKFDHYQRRLHTQQQWRAVLDATLRRCCRGYLTVSDRTSPARLGRDLVKMWARLVER